ncbi:hypothetical protein GGR56DRAFT_692468 [Xylariaceae sp. FL0804]|nr:hypothetical protein GGR56DRAFT_692468 [Xylariaceae sp. FL0804]
MMEALPEDDDIDSVDGLEGGSDVSRLDAAPNASRRIYHVDDDGLAITSTSPPRIPTRRGGRGAAGGGGEAAAAAAAGGSGPARHSRDTFEDVSLRSQYLPYPGRRPGGRPSRSSARGDEERETDEDGEDEDDDDDDDDGTPVAIDAARVPAHPDENRQATAERVAHLTRTINENIAVCIEVSSHMVKLAHENRHLAVQACGALDAYLLRPCGRAMQSTLRAYAPGLEARLRQAVGSVAAASAQWAAQGPGEERGGGGVSQLKERLIEQDAVLRDSSRHVRRLLAERNALRSQLEGPAAAATGRRDGAAVPPPTRHRRRRGGGRRGVQDDHHGDDDDDDDEGEREEGDEVEEDGDGDDDDEEEEEREQKRRLAKQLVELRVLVDQMGGIRDDKDDDEVPDDPDDADWTLL